MQLILRENVDKLGERGDVVDVAPGFARNYLLPKNLAMEVNDNNLRRIEKEKKLLAVQEAKEKGEAEALGGQLSEIVLTFRRKVHGEELYGSVSVSDVADALEAKGYKIEKRRILLAEPLKSLGEFTVKIRLHHDVTATIPVTVEKEEE
jgi:large subunit ribosomal protein L9